MLPGRHFCRTHTHTHTRIRREVRSEERNSRCSAQAAVAALAAHNKPARFCWVDAKVRGGE